MRIPARLSKCMLRKQQVYKDLMAGGAGGERSSAFAFASFALRVSGGGWEGL